MLSRQLRIWGSRRVLAMLLLAATPIQWLGCRERVEFSMQAWQGNVENREALADDLIERRLLIGLDRRQLRDLMGPGGYFGLGTDTLLGNEEWIYSLKPWSCLFSCSKAILTIHVRGGTVVAADKETIEWSGPGRPPGT